MLLRRQGSGRLAITQPSHAWLSGELARAFGNADFAVPQHIEAFCFAAEQHDIAWALHDAEPVFDPQTGWPRVFWDVPAAEHTALWSEGVRRARVFGRYPALLISLHGRSIYEVTFDAATAAPANAEAVRQFLSEQAALRSEIEASLRNDPVWRDAAAPSALERDRLLLLALDQISLHACWGVREAVEIPDVPTRGAARQTLRLKPSDDGAAIVIDPWPFHADRFRGALEGRLLAAPASDRQALLTAFAEAPIHAIEVELRPA